MSISFWVDADLEYGSEDGEIFRGQTLQRSAEADQRCDDLAGIGVCRADPEIDVFGRSRVTVSGQRMSAD